MTGKLLLRGARQLLTLRGSSSPRRGDSLRELSIIEDGALLISNGVIQEVGPSRRIEKIAEARHAVEIDAAGCVVLPGFVDSHTHLLDESRFKSKSWTQTRRRAEVRSRLGWFVRHGTTTIGAKTEDAKEARVLAALDGRPLDIVTTFIAASVESLKDAPRSARFISVRGENGAIEETTARAILTAAQAAGFSINVHGGAFASMAIELGAATFSHLEQTSPEELNLLAAASIIIPLLPGTAYQKRWRFGPGKRLVQRGAAIALATDFSPTSSRTVSIPMILSLACTHFGLEPAEAISAVTVNAAHALGLPRLVGSLEVGKQADVIIVDTPDYRDLPAYFGTNLVKLTMKRGQVLHREQEIEWPDD